MAPNLNIAPAGLLPEEEVTTALRRAGLAETVERLLMGLETFVLEDGGTLSGGERQRTMIARAIVGKPSIFYQPAPSTTTPRRSSARVSSGSRSRVL